MSKAEIVYKQQIHELKTKNEQLQILVRCLENKIIHMRNNYINVCLELAATAETDDFHSGIQCCIRAIKASCDN